ncbi:MAG: type II toxin-antitoxin system PemK/MazF family toxin [Steroidobacteraceae bacterium]
MAAIGRADLGDPIGSAPGYRRPVLVIQCDAINASRIGTVVCVPLSFGRPVMRARKIAFPGA